MLIDFHVCPSLDLGFVLSRLRVLDPFVIFVQPIDVDPTLYTILDSLINEFNLDKEVIMHWFNFIRAFIRSWPEHMLDYLKLRALANNVNGPIQAPFVSITPTLGLRYVESKLEELSELISSGIDIRGLVFAPTLQGFNPIRNKAFEAILEYAERNNLLVIIHLGPWFIHDAYLKELMPETLINTLSRYNVTFIISLTGLDDKPNVLIKWFDEFIRMKHRLAKFYLETSGINCLLMRTDIGKAVINRLSIDNIVFATGYPYYRFNRVLKEVNCIREARQLLKEEKEKILIDNALALINT